MDVYFADGSMVSFAEEARRRGSSRSRAGSSPRLEADRPHDRRGARPGDPRACLPRGRLRPPVGQALATTWTSTASRPGRTSGALGERLAGRVREVAPARRASPGPSSARVALAAAASLASGLPFLLVRKEAKGYGTENRLEGDFAAGEEVCLVEDVVTSGGAADAIDALRAAGLECRAAICV